MHGVSFYSHGKLLLTGEYTVLDGAKAIGLPCKLGQHLHVENAIENNFEWKSYLKDKSVWQIIKFAKEDISTFTSGEDFKQRLFQILHHIYILKPKLFQQPKRFSTFLEFDKKWGLGTSSTLINNLAKWAAIDPFQLLENTFGGSGYDIAAAESNTPFVFQKLENSFLRKAISISDSLKPNIYFIYLNKKQNSREGIKRYRDTNAVDKSSIIARISSISEKIPHVNTLEQFEDLLAEHENLIAKTIVQTPIQKLKFDDYKHGVVKSLGAWGGDFVLVTAKDASHLKYFRDKGYFTIFNYSELVLD